MPRHSLKGRKAIQVLLQTGKKCRSNWLILYWDKAKAVALGSYVVAILISSRSGGAVERNRIRRWLREDFQALQNINKIDGSFLIRFNGQAKEINHNSLTGELARLYNSVITNG